MGCDILFRFLAQARSVSVILVAIIATFSTEYAFAQTATEIFDFRLKCQALAEKFASVVSNDLGSSASSDELSNYSERFHHCYVLVKGYAAGGVLEKSKNNLHYLYDGQTGQMLAGERTVNGKCEGHVFDEDWDKENDGCGAADRYINLLMKTERYESEQSAK